MTLTRRSFAAGLVAAPVAASATPTVALADQSRILPPTARLSIGRFTVTIITDGFYDMPLGFFTGVEPNDLEARADATGAARDGRLRLGFIQYLVEDGDQKILVDTGPAGKIGDNTGRMPAALAALGVSPHEIEAVILTHTHFDHVSGALANGGPAFTNAQVYADRRDLDHFTDPARQAAAPDFLQSSFEATAALVAAYPNLERTMGNTRLAPGLEIVDLTGHTPGHVGVRVSDEGQSLVMASDMLFHPVVHPVSSAAGFVFEQDPAAAEAMRERFFADAAAEGTLVAATHMPFPGLGRIVPDRGRLEWVPAEWMS